jgi:hypothetical protein
MWWLMIYAIEFKHRLLNGGIWPSPDRHLKHILPAGTAGGLCNPPLRVQRPQGHEWLQPLHSRPTGEILDFEK